LTARTSLDGNDKLRLRAAFGEPVPADGSTIALRSVPDTFTNAATP
jgi:hypothetical protein